MIKKMSITIIISVVIIAGIIGTIIALALNKKHISDIVERDVIYDGIYIEKIHIGGLSKEEAIKHVQAEVKKLETQKQLKILAQGKELHLLPYSYFENEINYDALIEKAFQVARNGDIKTRYKQIKKLENEPIVFEIEDKYKEQKFIDLMSSLKPMFDIEPKDSYIERIDNVFVIHEEVIGKTIVLDESINNIKEAIKNELDSVELEVAETVPEVTKEVYEDIKDLIGNYYTEFSLSQPSRNENLRVASQFINGTVLFPGEVFSTNTTIGPVDATNGYKEAPIILNGKIQPGIGGGVCQIATTLYNAVLLAELEVVQRQNHSMPVGYIEKAKDATLAGDYIDFKFKNNTDTPIYIESYINENELHMNLYGKETRPPERKIGFESVIIDTIMPPPQKVTLDPSLKEGQEVVEKKATIGYTVKLYKKIYVNEELVENILVNTSTYGAVAAEVRKGIPVEPVIKVTVEPIQEDQSWQETIDEVQNDEFEQEGLFDEENIESIQGTPFQ